MSDEQRVPQESYGEFKMQLFKRNARKILGGNQEESVFMEELEYNQKEVTDVHTAYSRLKKELYKA